MNTITSSGSSCINDPSKLSQRYIAFLVDSFKGGPELVDGLVWAILDRAYRECGEDEYGLYLSFVTALKWALAYRKAARDGHLTAAKLWASTLVENVQAELDRRNKARLATTQLEELDAIEREYTTLSQQSPKPALKPIKVAPPKKPRMKSVAGNSFQEKLATLGAQAT